MAKKTAPVAEPVSRRERIVATLFGTMLGIAVLSIAALLIAGPRATGDIWLTIALLPPLALGAAVIFLVVLLVLTARRRSRDARVVGK